MPAGVLEWPDDPKPKERPKGRIQGHGKSAYVQLYTPEDTRKWENHVQTAVHNELRILGGRDDGQRVTLPLKKMILLTCRFNVTKPKSIPAAQTIPLTGRGDVDNLAKAIMDALQNAGVIDNDRHVTDLYTYRRYATPEHPLGVELDISGLG